MRSIFISLRRYTIPVIIGVLILLALISTFIVTITETHTPTAAPIQSIGQVQRVQGGVQSGPESSLANVDSTRMMDNKDAVHVFSHGKANLDFHYGLTFTLYNDTIGSGTTIGTDGTSRQAVFKLSQGGLQGHNPPGSKTTVELPNGVNILILDTDYFITYDPVVDEAWVYNFDGTVQYALPNAGYQDLPSGALLKIDNGQITRLYEGFSFSMDDFDSYATKLDSPIKAVLELLKIIAETGATDTPTLSTAIVGTTAAPMATVIRITFDPGQTTATRVGVINPNETIHYVVNAAQGQMLSINITAPANEVAIGINGPTGIGLKQMEAYPTWSTMVTTGGDYYINMITLTGGNSKSYTLEVSLTSPAANATNTPTTQIPTLTPNMTQTIQAVFDEVDTQFKESLRANIAYNVPKTMKLGEPITIELLLKPSQYQFEQATQLVEQNNFLTSTAEAGMLATKVIEEGGFLTSTAAPGQPVGKRGEEQKVITSDVIITPLMKAELKSLKSGVFEIQEFSSTVQPIGSIDTTKWRWSITAKESGEQSLELVISRLIKQDDNEYWREVEAYRADINVQVTASMWFKSLDWKWILGILVTALFIPLFFRWYDLRQKKDMLDSQDKSERRPAKKSKPVSNPRSSKGKPSLK